MNGQINSNSIEDGKVRAIAPIGLLANSHQSKKNVPGESNNKDIMNVSSSINSRIGDPEYVKHSRTIHNNINYSSSSSIVVLWMIPGLIFLLITAYFLVVETRELKKLSHVSVEISLIDNAGYYMWVALLHPHYINMKRIAVEGIVGSSDFSKWGFEDLNSNVSSVMGNPSFQNQLLMTENLVDINQANSSYTSMYNRRLTSSKVYDMMYYRESDSTIEMIKVRRVDANKYLTLYLNELLGTDYIDNHPLGSNLDLNKSPKEKIVKYNLLNPVLNYYIERTFCFMFSVRWKYPRVGIHTR